MMRPNVVVLTDTSRREYAHLLVNEVPEGYRVEFKEPKRSDAQNDRMWAMLADISRQTTWHGLTLSDEDWKDLLTAGLRKSRVVPNLDGDGFVTLGLRTSKMSVREMTALMDLMEHFAAERGVVFRAPAHQGEPA